MVASTLLYICVFFISTVLFWLSQKLKSNLLAVLGLLVPCLLSAFRSSNVGQDVSLYVVPNIEAGQEFVSKGFFFFYENIPMPVEIGFAFLLYVGVLLNSLSVIFFLIQILVIFPVYMALKMYGDKVSLPLGMLTFYLLSYHFSLSGMRVSIAMSLLLYAFVLYRKLKISKSILVVLLASLFHNSVFLVLLLLLMIIFLFKTKRRKSLLALGGLSLFVMFFFFHKVLNAVAFIVSVANPRYAYYLYEYAGRGSFADVPTMDFFVKTLLILLAFFLIVNKKKMRLSFYNIYTFVFVCVLLGRFFVLFNAVFYESLRIAFYFDMFLVLWVAFVPRCYSKECSSHRFGISVLCSTLSFVYWAFMMTKGAYGTSVYSLNW